MTTSINARLRVAKEIKESGKADTYIIANLVGRRERIGKSVKHTTKRAAAARFSPPNINNLSHLLTKHSC